VDPRLRQQPREFDCALFRAAFSDEEVVYDGSAPRPERFLDLGRREAVSAAAAGHSWES
jgi:hypothetical protein